MKTKTRKKGTRTFGTHQMIYYPNTPDRRLRSSVEG